MVFDYKREFPTLSMYESEVMLPLLTIPPDLSNMEGQHPIKLERLDRHLLHSSS